MQESDDWRMMRQPGSVQWEYVSLAEVTVHSGDRGLDRWCKHVPMVGKWSPDGGFDFNGTPHGMPDKTVEYLEELNREWFTGGYNDIAAHSELEA